MEKSQYLRFLFPDVWPSNKGCETLCFGIVRSYLKLFGARGLAWRDVRNVPHISALSHCCTPQYPRLMPSPPSKCHMSSCQATPVATAAQENKLNWLVLHTAPSCLWSTRPWTWDESNGLLFSDLWVLIFVLTDCKGWGNRWILNILGHSCGSSKFVS